ncbi:DNA sulfur modification protein DndD [Acinetobacter baumannii]|uniref:DNA sulfur modification protein DndD n=1 Tax=Acinetobacter baumannii TaxID=470 RepID=UPI0008103B76|nr:DNA sulfur modification protein DndD [Acinetobacter baumannii]MCG6644541.1 DNA sulfur modification protein DndD [Acinetobacter baumannii]MDC5029623.1 DNA sulfur modification protein DndD [Acinetobacter baumannii]MDN8191072.1 DNA sulfur modification protein DndD [Acinetobacter baumannii]
MIIKSLILDNVGLYSQRTEFSLEPKKSSVTNRPIILIGGRNGAGKTTFLDSVRLALYGKRALGLGINNKDYQQYLLSKMNQNHLERASSVELTFLYTEGSLPAEFKVCRSWSLAADGQIHEKLDLQKNGSTVTSVPEQEWENFLLELIPIGVSQLFFFDGEKIQDIAEDNNTSLSDAIKNLLGIDLIEKLRLDLHSYLNRNKSDNAGQNDVELLTQHLNELKSKENQLNNEYAQLKFEHQTLLKNIEQKRLRFVSEGGAIALEYDQLKAKRSQLNKDINLCKQELVSLANGFLPFLFAPKLIAKFTKQLENSSADQSLSQKLVDQALNSFKTSSVQKKELWKDEHWQNLNEFLVNYFNTAPQQSSHIAFMELTEPREALAKLLSLDAEVKKQVKSLYERFTFLNQEKEATEFSIARAENAEDSNAYLDELLHKERKLGELDLILNQKEEEVRKISWDIVTAGRNLKAASEAVAEFELQNHKNTLAAKGIKALIEFEVALLEQKINQVRHNFVEIFNSLLRKRNFITDLQIDSKTFNTRLIKTNGKVIEKSALSAGEKQIYAIAMLWSLAKTSGRHLPMIVDTPLGRLDREHRDNLMKFYFPQVSHQVIILSTDTEIDDLYVNQLNDFISESYLLEYNHELGSTQVLPGYFTNLKRTNTEKRIALQQA